MMIIPTALLHKYATTGPRYTSYPTALHFREDFGPARWSEALSASRQQGRELSLYVHIPFCDTLCYYCGCNMVATRDYRKAEAYLEVLCRDIAQLAREAGEARVVRQIHWGGGTPTYLRPEDMRRLFGCLAQHFSIAADAEIGCEMDPRELSQAQVETLRELGFNRLSLGVQDLDADVQQAVNRVQPLDLIERVYGWIRAAGFASVNFDLMTGLPRQTPERFARTLEAVVALAPERFAVFGYAHVPWMKKHQKLIHEEELPQLEQRLALQQLTLETLTRAGYEHIGMDHFARPDDELVQAQRKKTLHRNFQGYTTHRHCDILAFGASAISQTEDVYAQNFKQLSTYRQRVQAGSLPVEKGLAVTPADRIRRAAITQLMCELELDTAAFGRQWQLDFDDYFAAARTPLEEMQADGLLALEGGCIRVSERGRVFLRNIAMVFDAYLAAPQGQTPRYSRTL